MTAGLWAEDAERKLKVAAARRVPALDRFAALETGSEAKIKKGYGTGNIFIVGEFSFSVPTNRLPVVKSGETSDFSHGDCAEPAHRRHRDA
jgi:hypothetical protein